MYVFREKICDFTPQFCPDWLTPVPHILSNYQFYELLKEQIRLNLEFFSGLMSG
jgi:hypothetical protein